MTKGTKQWETWQEDSSMHMKWLVDKWKTGDRKWNSDISEIPSDEIWTFPWEHQLNSPNLSISMYGTYST